MSLYRHYQTLLDMLPQREPRCADRRGHVWVNVHTRDCAQCARCGYRRVRLDPAAYARGSWAEFGAYLRRFGVQVGRDAFFATLPTIDGDEVSLVAAGADVSTADNVQCHSCGSMLDRSL